MNQILLTGRVFNSITKQNNIQHNYKEYQLLSHNLTKKFNLFDNNISKLCDVFNTMVQSNYPKFLSFLITKEILKQNQFKYNFGEWQTLYESLNILLVELENRLSILENRTRTWYYIERIEIHNYADYRNNNSSYRINNADYFSTGFHSEPNSKTLNENVSPNPIILNFLPTDAINRYFRLLDNFSIYDRGMTIKFFANKTILPGD